MTRIPVFLLLILLANPSSGQTFNELALEVLARPDYFSSYKKIDVEWKMAGKIQADLNEGLNNLLEGNLSLAIGSLNNVLKQDSQIWQAYYYIGVSNRSLGEIKLAEKYFEQMNERHQHFYDGQLEMGKTLMLGGDLIEAQQYFLACVKIDSLRPEAYLLLGDLALRRNDVDGAQQNYTKCLNVDTKFNTARIRLGIIAAFKSKDPFSAMPMLNQVIEHDSTNREALLFRTLVMLRADPAASLIDIDRVIRSAPAIPNFRYLRGILLTYLNETDKAFSDFTVVIREVQVNENNFRGKQSAMDKKIDLQNARAFIMSRIYSLDEENATLVKKAFCKLIVGDYGGCISTLKQVRRFDKSGLCLYIAGIASEHSGQHQSARNYYLQSLKFDKSILDAHKKVGIYASNSHLWTMADKEFSKVLELNPQLSLIYKLRGVARYQKGNLHGALSDFSSALQLDSTDFESITDRIKTNEKLGNTGSILKDEAMLNNLRAFRYTEILNKINTILKNRDTVAVLNYLDQYIYQTRSTAASIFKVKILFNRKEWVKVSDEATFAISLLNPSFYFKDEHAFLLVMNGKFYAWAKNEKLAEEQFNKAMGVDANYSSAYLERGRLYLIQGKTEMAKKDLKRAVELGEVDEGTKLLQSIKIN